METKKILTQREYHFYPNEIEAKSWEELFFKLMDKQEEKLGDIIKLKLSAETEIDYENEYPVLRLYVDYERDETDKEYDRRVKLQAKAFQMAQLKKNTKAKNLEEWLATVERA